MKKRDVLTTFIFCLVWFYASTQALATEKRETPSPASDELRTIDHISTPISSDSSMPEWERLLAGEEPEIEFEEVDEWGYGEEDYPEMYGEYQKQGGGLPFDRWKRIFKMLEDRKKKSEEKKEEEGEKERDENGDKDGESEEGSMTKIFSYPTDYELTLDNLPRWLVPEDLEEFFFPELPKKKKPSPGPYPDYDDYDYDDYDDGKPIYEG